ncbi:Swi3-domain-containing protein [Thelephora ganbajun]|uniref:Swi3-domain-containing protein n=1 Tax=Thelephora ganbajun TaxID=370292 RepID=A0ACB6ZQX1_THEGA|nr:Swi3-domain-containing protein [Thelephora ganbajun]
MATIDDLWDEPVESEPIPHLTANPVTSEGPLFLQSDSDNEGRMGAAVPTPSKVPDDIGALFEVDDDDENGQLSNVTYEQLRKDAQSGGKVPDDGPSNEGSQGTEGDPSKEASTAKSKSDKKGEGGDTGSAKRTIPKLDEELLLSEKGIRALIKDAKRWQPKGKGHEVSDLNRLIRMYQYWAHQMYPRHTFNDTIERVEKLTHSRRMHVALSAWHDEARGISRHQAPPEESIDIDGINSDEEGQTDPSGSGQPSEPPTRPPSSASEQTSGPDGDFEMGGVSGAKSIGTQGGGDEFDFEVEMWDDIPFTDGPTSTSNNQTNPSTIDPQKRLARPPAPSFNQEDDQDVWDLVDELQARAKSNGDANPPGKPPTPVDEDDWDDMYA